MRRLENFYRIWRQTSLIQRPGANGRRLVSKLSANASQDTLELNSDACLQGKDNAQQPYLTSPEPSKSSWFPGPEPRSTYSPSIFRNLNLETEELQLLRPLRWPICLMSDTPATRTLRDRRTRLPCARSSWELRMGLGVV